ncbi:MULTISPECIES: hypothetical protein [Psychrobacter]|nr:MULTISPECIES: hypothetical protein [Psychrobacter]
MALPAVIIIMAGYEKLSIATHCPHRPVETETVGLNPKKIHQ